MCRHLIILGFLITSVYSCTKDKAITPPADTTIHNDLIAGGGATSFQRIIGGQKLDAFYSCKQTNDGGYVFCGFTENDGASERDVILLKTNSLGETSWTKRFSGNYSDQSWFVEATNDNGFILGMNSSLCAYQWPPIQCASSSKLIKTDNNGNQVWEKSYSNVNGISDVRQTNDGGYIAIGSESSSMIILKTDASGNETWRKNFNSLISLEYISKTNDGGFIICGERKANSSSPTDTYIIRANSTGDTLWTKTFVDTLENTTTSIKETASGNIVLCGYTGDQHGYTGFAKLLNPNGGQIWHTDFTNPNIEALSSISVTNDNQFIATGHQWGNPAYAYLVKIDSSGNSIWTKSFIPKGYNAFYEVQPTTDNGFIIAGYGSGDAYVVKTDANGN